MTRPDETPQYEPTTVMMLVLILMLPLSIAWFAWIALTLYGWFLLPLGAPALGLAQMAGVSLAFRYSANGFPMPTVTYRSESEFIVRAFVWPVFAGLWVLAVGYVIRVVAA